MADWSQVITCGCFARFVGLANAAGLLFHTSQGLRALLRTLGSRLLLHMARPRWHCHVVAWLFGFYFPASLLHFSWPDSASLGLPYRLSHCLTPDHALQLRCDR